MSRKESLLKTKGFLSGRQKMSPLPHFQAASEKSPEEFHAFASKAGLNVKDMPGGFKGLHNKLSGRMVAMYHPESRNFSYAPKQGGVPVSLKKSDEDGLFADEDNESLFKTAEFEAVVEVADGLDGADRDSFLDGAIEPLVKGFLDSRMDEVADDFRKITASQGIRFDYLRKRQGSLRECRYVVGPNVIVHRDLGNDIKIDLRKSDRATDAENVVAMALRNRLASYYDYGRYLRNGSDAILAKTEDALLKQISTPVGGAGWVLANKQKEKLQSAFARKRGFRNRKGGAGLRSALAALWGRIGKTSLDRADLSKIAIGPDKSGIGGPTKTSGGKTGGSKFSGSAPSVKPPAAPKLAKTVMTSSESKGIDNFEGRIQSKAHGWISPDGAYIQWHRKEPHHTIEVQHDKPMSHFYDKGWLSIGHGGGHNIQGRRHILTDPNHPAVKTARTLASKYFGDITSLHFAEEDGHPRPWENKNPEYKSQDWVDISTAHFLRHGTIPKKGSVADIRSNPMMKSSIFKLAKRRAIRKNFSNPGQDAIVGV